MPWQRYVKMSGVFPGDRTPFLFEEDCTMRSKLLLSLALAVVLGGVAYSLALATSGERNDCPGKVLCPITGEEICKDRCPLLDAARANCPGKVECPLTGELVCRNECPIETTSAAAAACCSKKE